MVENGDFEKDGGSLSEWYNQGPITKTLTEEDGSHTVVVMVRIHIHNDIVQNIGTTITCLSGIRFYLCLTARVCLYYHLTGNGVWYCTHDHFYTDRKWLWLNCPFFRVSTFRGGVNEDVFEACKTNMEWESSYGAWNNLDLIVEIPNTQTEKGFSHFYVIVLVGAPQTNLVVDNVVVKSLEEADLPEDQPIYYPTHSTRNVVNFSDNIILNGDGEYQSPFMWDSYGNWFSPTTLDVHAPGYDGTGYYLISYKRVHVLNGTGKHFSHVCFVYCNYYIRIETGLMMYDQETGRHTNACSNKYTQTKQI